jgi:molecular chaperone GrpE
LFVEGADSNPEVDESSDGTCDQDAVVQLQNQVDDANSRLLRSQAELDNFRKRSRREMEDQRRHAQFPIMSDLLAVTDQLKSILERHHCQMIEVGEGDVFDPNCHEAISQQPSADHPAGSVLFVTQNGYRLHERIVRPAQVVVSTESDDLQASS